MSSIKKPELLAPAGDLEKLKVAVLYGADAVFLGLQKYGLRSGAGNFTLEDVKEGVEFANKYGAKVYVTTNIFAHEENYEGFKETVIELDKIGVVGIIVSDPGYIKIAQENTNLEIHISTQQSINNSLAVDFYKDMGAQRVVLGRELSKEEIKSIRDKVDIELEVFIHGAVCSSYSGRCTLSNHMTLRDSNRGGCCQSCRWNYDIGYKDKDNNFVSCSKEEKFNMSAKDMNLLPDIASLIEMGVDSFKIEGRMKSLHYVATVVKVYRMAIDSYFEDPKNYVIKDEWSKELEKSETRESSIGAYNGIVDKRAMILGEQYQKKSYDYCGYVLDYDEDTKIATIEQRNFFKVGDTIEFTGPNVKPFLQEVKEIIDDEGNSILKANHPLMIVKLKLDKPVKKHFIIRKEN